MNWNANWTLVGLSGAAGILLAGCLSIDSLDPITSYSTEKGSSASTAVERTNGQPSQANRVQSKVVVSGLDRPWAVVSSPEGQIWILEIDGVIKIFDSSFQLQHQMTGLPDLNPSGQGGLLDVAFHPQYLSNRCVYFVYTVRDVATRRHHARVMRFRYVNGNLIEPLKLIDGGQSDDGAHFGSRLVFDENGYLYASFGDRHTPERVQDLNTMYGKIVRLRDDGSIPDDNPFPGSAVFSLGHRNPQGLDYHPGLKQLFNSEHGPTGYDGPSGGDEINRVRSGGNYGWPVVSHDLSQPNRVRPGMISPITEYTPAVAPSGIALYRHDRFQVWKDSLFVASLRGSRLIRLELNSTGAVERQEILLLNQYGRLRDVGVSPNGTVLVVSDAGDLIEVEVGM